MVCLPFFVERLLEQLGVALESKLPGVGTNGPVTSHLVMLDALSLRDQTCVQNVGIRTLLDKLASFFDQPFHADTFLAARADAQVLANLLQPYRVLGGLPEMRSKRLLQLLVGRGFRHF